MVPQAPQTVDELLAQIDEGEREANRWLQTQLRGQLQAKTELEQRERDRVQLRSNLSELCGFRNPVVILKEFVAARDALRASILASAQLKKALFESEAAVTKAKKEIFPGFATRRALLTRKSAVVLQFKRPENTNEQSAQ